MKARLSEGLRRAIPFVISRLRTTILWILQAMSSNLLHLKQAMRATWMAGDFRQIERYMEREDEAFVERLGIIPGMKVLDVACGTGNVAVPAARQGAQVVGIDIAPNLVEQARQRAVAESLEATFEEGDAEQLPYHDGHFDVVTSMFGAMFAPRPEQVASELARARTLQNLRAPMHQKKIALFTVASTAGFR